MRAVLVLFIAASAGITGCASSPEYVASQSNWDVCRLTMRGPHARNAEVEAQRRGLDCRPYYGAIQQQLANENAAVINFMNATRPTPIAPPVSCTSQRLGNTVQTYCN